VYYKGLYDMKQLLEQKEEYEPVIISGESDFVIKNGQLHCAKLDEPYLGGQIANVYTGSDQVASGFALCYAPYHGIDSYTSAGSITISDGSSFQTTSFTVGGFPINIDNNRFNTFVDLPAGSVGSSSTGCVLLHESC